jgi:hypothetical protein
MTYYDWQITHSELMPWVSQQAGIPIQQRDSRVGSLSEFAEFDRAPTLDQTRAPKTPLNLNRFR